MTHCPGPWRIDDISSQDVIARVGHIAIASANLGPQPARDDAANARLIAAAPELLAVARALLEIPLVAGEHTRADYAVHQMARDVVARATATVTMAADDGSTGELRVLPDGTLAYRRQD